MDSQPQMDSQGFIELERLEGTLVASLRWCGVRWRSRDGLLGRAFECYRRLLGSANGLGYAHLPLSVVVDVYALVVLGDRTPFASDAGEEKGLDREGIAEEDNQLRRDYENRVLSRLLAEPSFRDARERMALRPQSDHRGVQRLVEFVLARFAPLFPQGPRVHPARLRSVELKSPIKKNASLEADDAYEGARRDQQGAGLERRLREFVERVVERVAWTGLLQEADLFELEHWQQLGDASLRTGCRQLVGLAAELAEPAMPHVRPSEEFADVQTEMTDDSVYPRGGFAGLTNRGSFENLVRSELVFIEPGAEVSVFDLRFAQNELLYYLRNDGSLRRRRRDVRFVFDVADSFPVRLAGWPARYATVMQAVAIRLVRDLLDVYEDDAVCAEMIYLLADRDGPLASSAAEERALVEVVMQEEVAKGWLEFSGPEPAPAIDTPERITHMVVFAAGPEAVRLWTERLGAWRAAGLPVTAAVVVTGADGAAFESTDVRVFSLPDGPLPTDVLGELSHALYATLLGADLKRVPLPRLSDHLGSHSGSF